MPRTAISTTRTNAGVRSNTNNRFLVRNLGTSLKFDTADNRVIVASPTLTHVSEKTVAIWIKLDNIVNGQSIFTFSTGSSARESITLQANTRKIRVDHVGTASGRRFDSTTNFVPNTWYHIAYTHTLFNGASCPAGGILTYINGVLETTTETVPGGASGASTEIALGVVGSAALTSDYKGLIDDIRTWSSALTAQQISDLYFKNINPSTPLNWWKFDEGSGSTATDSGADAKDGAITGATYSSDVFTIPRTAIS